MRIGLIHISRRADTWANYHVWTLRRFGQELIDTHEPPIEVQDCCLPIGPFPECMWRPPDCDVYLRIDDSLMYDTPPEYRPLIYYCSDSHVQDGVGRAEIAAGADWTFCAQRDATKPFGGFGDAWLPHRAWFRPEPQERKVGIASCITLSDNNLFGPRTRLARRIASKVPKLSQAPLAGQIVIRGGVWHSPMAQLYSQSQIVWHCGVGNDIPMRILEGAACGACVVSSRITDNGLEDMFGDLIPQFDIPQDCLNAGDDLQHEIDTPDPCIDLLCDLLSKPDECAERGRAIREIVLDRYCYEHAVNAILDKAIDLACGQDDGLDADQEPDLKLVMP